MSTRVVVEVYHDGGNLRFDRSGIPDYQRSVSDRGRRRDVLEAAAIIDQIAAELQRIYPDGAA